MSVDMWTCFRNHINYYLSYNTLTNIKFLLLPQPQTFLFLQKKLPGERVRKWPICSKVDSTHARVRP